jgi:hypothetical protein
VNSTRLSGREMAELLAEFVEVVTRQTHRTLQQNAFQLMLKTIKAWAQLPESMYDFRNEAAVKGCRLMWQSWQKQMSLLQSWPFV